MYVPTVGFSNFWIRESLWEILKHYYREKVRANLLASGRSVTHYDISEMFGRPHLKAQTVDNPVNGFRVSGIYSAKR